MPADVIQYLVGLSLSLLNLNFLPLNKIPGIGFIFEIFSQEQQNSYLYLLGFESGSAVINMLSIFGFSLLIPIIHIVVYFIQK